MRIIEKVEIEGEYWYFIMSKTGRLGLKVRYYPNKRPLSVINAMKPCNFLSTVEHMYGNELSVIAEKIVLSLEIDKLIEGET